MARNGTLDASELVARELLRLKAQSMDFEEFNAQAVFTDVERAAVNEAMNKRQPWAFVDAVNYSPPKMMIGTFADLRKKGAK